MTEPVPERPDPLAKLRHRDHATLVREVVSACNLLPGVHLYRVDVGRGGPGRRAHGDAGVPDVIGWISDPTRGQAPACVPVAFEVKVGPDRLRPLQQDFLERLARAGGIAAEIRSAEQAVRVLRGAD